MIRVFTLLLVVILASDLSNAGRQRSSVNCPDGWKPLHRRSCYLIVSRPPSSWTDAKQDCIKEGAQLISVASVAKLNKIKSALKNETNSRKTWWIGMYRDDSDWQWLDNSQVSDRIPPWKTGEPNNDGGNENCVEMNKDGEKNDKKCNSLRPFICEKGFGEIDNERAASKERTTQGSGRRTSTPQSRKDKKEKEEDDDEDDDDEDDDDDNEGNRTTDDDDEEDLYELYAGCYFRGNPSRRNRRPFPYTVGARFCPQVVAKRVTWPESEHDVIRSHPCRRGNGEMTFECGGSPTCWRDEPNVEQCASPAFRKLVDRIALNKNSTETPEQEETLAVTSELANVTGDDDVTEEDITVTSQLINNLVKRGATRKIKDRKKMKSFVGNVMKAGSNLVSRRKSRVWSHMTQDDKLRSATNLLVAMETATVAMAKELEEPATIVTHDENIELELRVVNTSTMAPEKHAIQYRAQDSDSQFAIPLDTINHLSSGGLAKMVFMTHYTMGSILGNTTTDDNNDNNSTATTDNTSDDSEDQHPQPKLVTYIVSATMASTKAAVLLPQPVIFTISHTEDIPEGFEPLCSFWKISESGLGEWSQAGCRLVDSNTSHTQCQCDHMTNFAVLMAVKEVQISETHKTALRVITIVGCVISCLCLLASFITFVCFAPLQGERNSIHKNLVVCIFVAEMLFLTGIDQTQNRAVCGIIAGCLHYFFLAAFLWMLMEGVHIVLMLVQVFDASKSRMRYYYAASYGISALIVVIAAGVYSDGYGTDAYCWLSTGRGFIWSFGGPVALILLVNSVILGYAMTMVCRHSEYVFSTKDKTSAGGIRSWIQGAMALEVLLGLTWSLGFFFLTEQTVVLAYLFTVLNSTQGLFIFLFHCVLNKKARKEYRRVINMRRQSPSTTGSGSATHSASLAKNKLTSGASFNKHGSSQDTSPTDL